MRTKTFRWFAPILFISLLGLALGSCGGGGGGGDNGNTPPIGDLSGTWQVTGTESSPTPACDGVPINVIATIVQSGNNLTVNGDDGSVLSGTISGNTVSMSGTYPEDGGTTVVSSLSATVAADCNSFSGSSVWSWTDGASSCSGTSTYNGVRLTGSGCGVNIPVTETNILGVWRRTDTGQDNKGKEYLSGGTGYLGNFTSGPFTRASGFRWILNSTPTTSTFTEFRLFDSTTNNEDVTEFTGSIMTQLRQEDGKYRHWSLQ